jgi:uncharacterized protein YbbC (DUF1343 family)/CubicO group peptidase (beta-lactamase class C family)
MTSFLLTVALLASGCAAAAQDFPGAPHIDREMNEAVASGLIPGGVVVVGTHEKILFQKAYGFRSLVPAKTPMTEDTIFDAASLTKVVATTSAVAKLFEQGKIRISDPVTHYLPEFQGGKSNITVRDLLVHFSGLRPDVDLEPKWSGYDTGIRLALVDKPRSEPGTRFVYSDINFVLLGEIVRRVSGVPLDEYCRREIFAPLGMRDSGFNPAPSLKPRIAPTEIENGLLTHGVVHDPTARNMGGVAGHAGLFTTAADLSRFAKMLVNGGELDGQRILAPLTVRKFATPHTPAGQAILRGLGWDMDSPFSGNRGELYPIGSFGHTGFTGTSLWIDPHTRTYVVLLTNYVHPKRGKSLTALRGKVATISAAAFGLDAQNVLLAGYNDASGPGVRRVINRNASVEPGLDVLVQSRLDLLRGKKVGLITNHTGLSRNGQRNLDILLKAGVNLVAVFSPEHGLEGRLDQENVPNSKDEATGLPVWSLYQPKTRKPTAETLRGAEILLFDIQDVGARFYTYSCTLVNTLETAAQLGIPYVVLDRPNPITGAIVEGPLIEADLQSFIGCHDLPTRHGLTLGELAQMVNAERKWGAKLTVVPAKNWQRGDWFDATGLLWRDPSPNMRSLTAATLYSGLALLEFARNYSVGRGTDAPFEQIGADWIQGPELARHLNSRFIPGVRVYPVAFRPTASNFAGKTIQGVRFVITDRELFSATRLGLEIAAALQKLYPGKIDFDANAKLIGSRWVVEALKRGDDARTIYERTEAEKEKYLARRARYLLYPK